MCNSLHSPQSAVKLHCIPAMHTPYMKMNKDIIKALIEKSLKELVRKDGRLIHRKVREECINHRLSCYLGRFLNVESHISYSVDLEYNKNYNVPKKISSVKLIVSIIAHFHFQRKKESL